VGGGFVWVVNSLDGTLSQIDPNASGGSVVQEIPIGNGPTAAAFGEGGVWVANSADRTVVRIDPSTGLPGPPIAVPEGADSLAAGAGSVWVASESGARSPASILAQGG
jgi:DNA-binding beta-propeller fold protein YncE